MRKLAGDTKRPFRVRHAALRTADWFVTERRDLVPRRELLAVVGPLLDQEDIADLAVERLRKWRCWDLTERVLALSERRFGEASMKKLVDRSLLRYALQCLDPRCKTFLASERKKEPERVRDVEEMLELEEGKQSESQ